MIIENFTCKYLLKEIYLDYKLSGYGLGTRAIFTSVYSVFSTVI